MNGHSRRGFLRAAAGASLALPLAGLSRGVANRAAGDYMGRIGVALYTVRDRLGERTGDTLRKIAAMGCSHVEAQYNQLLPLKSPLADAGLRVSSVHVDLGVVSGDPKDAAPGTGARPAPGEFDRALQAASDAGASHLGLAYLRADQRGTLDHYRQIASILNVAGARAKEAGISFFYHNHAFEFRPQEGSTPFEAMVAELDPELVSLEMDVFWLHMAGIDPLPFLREHARRIAMLHLKDASGEVGLSYDEGTVSSETPEAFQHLGNGVVDIAGVVEFAIEQDLAHCYIEQDITPGDPLESLRASYEYLAKLGV